MQQIADCGRCLPSAGTKLLQPGAYSASKRGYPPSQACQRIGFFRIVDVFKICHMIDLKRYLRSL